MTGPERRGPWQPEHSRRLWFPGRARLSRPGQWARADGPAVRRGPGLTAPRRDPAGQAWMWVNTAAAAGSVAVVLAVSAWWGLAALGLTACSAAARIIRAFWRDERRNLWNPWR